MCSEGQDTYDSWQSYIPKLAAAKKNKDNAKGQVESIKHSLARAKAHRATQKRLMDTYDNAMTGLYKDLLPYLEELEERRAEIRAIVTEVLGDIPNKISQLESESERKNAENSELKAEIKQLDEEKSEEIKRLTEKVESNESTIKDLQSAIESLQSTMESLQQR